MFQVERIAVMRIFLCIHSEYIWGEVVVVLGGGGAVGALLSAAVSVALSVKNGVNNVIFLI